MYRDLWKITKLKESSGLNQYIRFDQYGIFHYESNFYYSNFAAMEITILITKDIYIEMARKLFVSLHLACFPDEFP